MSNVQAVDPHGLTPAELAYMESGGDTDELVKTGELKPGERPVDEKLPDVPSPPLAPEAQADAGKPPATDSDDEEPDIDPKTERPKQKGRWVAKKALDEERNERQRLSQQLAEKSEQWARLEERFKVFQEALNTPDEPVEEPEPDLPDPEQDIIGFNRGLHTRYERRFARQENELQQLRDQLGQFNQETAAGREQNQLLNRYRMDAQTFAQKQPDFVDAYKFLISSRDAELQAAGYNDPLERQRLIVADEQALAQRALEGRASPAERLYALAKARGYQEAKTNGTATPAPASSAPAPAAPAQPSVTDEIARLQKGQEAAMSLSNVGGQRTNALSIQDLINMPEGEFRAFARKNPALLEAMAGREQ